VAGVVVRDDARVLAIQRADNGTWEPPGGVLELSESIEDGVRREVYEETGVLVSVERLTGVYKNVARGVVALVFLCRQEGGHVRLSEESIAVEWLTPSEVTERMGEVFAIRILNAITEAERAAIRTHDGRAILR
jgi:ADP-ribose pyrophosphatase YjhB (NUDIX family)